jgi:ABC-type arginine/histidine transport system permease subunit
MNKEQIKHLTDVLKDVAIGQFMFAGGKNLYLYSKSNDFDLEVLIISGAIYIIIHGIIHLVLSELED